MPVSTCSLIASLDRDDARQPIPVPWFASMAYVLLSPVRRIGLAHTCTSSHRPPAAPSGLKLLKLGALVRVSVRRIKVALASACPYQNEFALAHARLRNAAAA